MSLGPRLKRYRTRLRISQAELSRRSGVRAALISELEGGKRQNTQARIVQRLARALGVTIAMLLGEDTNTQDRRRPYTMILWTSAMV